MNTKNDNKKKMNCIIVTPWQRAGGPIALHALCHYLAEQGVRAKVFYTDEWRYLPEMKVAYWRHWIQFCIRDAKKMLQVTFGNRRKYLDDSKYWGYAYAPVKGCRRKWLPFVGKNTVVVYPEKMYGNPLKAKHVVRWLLYYDRFPDEHDKAYGANDVFMCYRFCVNDEKLNPNNYKLETPYFDMDLYKRTNYGKREGDCYILRKGKNRDDLPKEINGIVIDDLPEPIKVEVFNSSERCISYDTETHYSPIAALCGCQSIVVPEPGKTRKDYRTEDDWECGVAIGFDENEIQFAKDTVGLLPSRFEACHDIARKDVSEFINICNAEFF